MGGFFATGDWTSGSSPTNNPAASPAPTRDTAASLSGSGPGQGSGAVRNPDRTVPNTATGSTDNSFSSAPATSAPTTASASALAPPIQGGTLLPPSNKAAAILSGFPGAGRGPSASGPVNPMAGVNTQAPTTVTNAPSNSPFDFSKYVGVGPYGQNASANYNYFSTNPTAAGNPAAPAGVPTSGYTPYGGPLGFLGGTAIQGSGPNDANGQPIVTSYNPQYYADPGTAAGLAKWLGSGYGVGSQPGPTGVGSVFGSPAEATLTGPNGSSANAGEVADYVQRFGQAGQSPAYLQQLLSSAFGTAAPLPLGSTGNVPQGPGASAAATGVSGLGPGSTATGPTPGNPNQSATPGYNVAQGQGGLSSADLQSFLQAYGQLSAGGQQPATSATGAPAQGLNNLSLQQLIQQLTGNTDLYRGNQGRDYPATP